MPRDRSLPLATRPWLPFPGFPAGYAGGTVRPKGHMTPEGQRSEGASQLCVLLRHPTDTPTVEGSLGHPFLRDQATPGPRPLFPAAHWAVWRPRSQVDAGRARATQAPDQWAPPPAHPRPVWSTGRQAPVPPGPLQCLSGRWLSQPHSFHSGLGVFLAGLIARTPRRPGGLGTGRGCWSRPRVRASRLGAECPCAQRPCLLFPILTSQGSSSGLRSGRGPGKVLVFHSLCV